MFLFKDCFIYINKTHCSYVSSSKNSVRYARLIFRSISGSKLSDPLSDLLITEWLSGTCLQWRWWSLLRPIDKRRQRTRTEPRPFMLSVSLATTEPNLLNVYFKLLLAVILKLQFLWGSFSVSFESKLNFSVRKKFLLPNLCIPHTETEQPISIKLLRSLWMQMSSTLTWSNARSISSGF